MRVAAGLICAMSQEFEALREGSGLDWDELGENPFVSFAAEREGVRLVAAISGIGKSKAAAASQFLVDRHSPCRLISFGLAGALSASMKEGELALPRCVLQGDVGIYHRGGFSHPLSRRLKGGGMTLSHHQDSEEPLRGDIALLLRHRGISVHEEPLVTCDQAVFSRARREELSDLTGACAVDMESGAVAIVAVKNALPFLVIRSISDTLDMEIADGSFLFLLVSERKADRLRLAGQIAVNREARRSVWAFREGLKLAYRSLALAAQALLEHLSSIA